MKQKRFKFLVVCTGNICRSPTAEGVLRKKIADIGMSKQIFVDSAGTHGYHVGEQPDERSCHAAKYRGYDLSKLTSRRVKEQDFFDFDLILAMDSGHLDSLRKIQPTRSRARLDLYLEFSRRFYKQSVPDPYYGGEEGFEHVLDMIEEGADRILENFLPPPN